MEVMEKKRIKIKVIRSIEIDEAIDDAIEIFKKNGYEITRDQAHSLCDLAGEWVAVRLLSIKTFKDFFIAEG